MRKILVAKIFVVLFLCLMAGTVIQSAFFNPTPLYAAGWGDKYHNDQGQYLCICAEENECYPCMILPI